MNIDSQREGSGTALGPARVVLPCAELQPALDFFVERLGFRLDRISPADDPRTADLSGHGLALELRRSSDAPPATLAIECDDPAALDLGGDLVVAPNGTRIELRGPKAPRELSPPEPELVLSRAANDAVWITGRAGMQYRDLIPGRLGGRFIASHIRIPDGGPVPDRVHYHHVRFQTIFCARGWVRVVYEDQGPPFVLEAGDCVVQPPRIRHRVLESSPGLEVIELATPAEHDTWLDHELELPTGEVHPDRDFGGQRFVRHVASAAEWAPWCASGYECRDTGIGAATGGLAGVRVARPRAADGPATWRHDGEFGFLFVLDGSVELHGARNEPLRLATGDAASLPAGVAIELREASPDLELLEVRLPAARGATST